MIGCCGLLASIVLVCLVFVSLTCWTKATLSSAKVFDYNIYFPFQLKQYKNFGVWNENQTQALVRASSMAICLMGFSHSFDVHFVFVYNITATMLHRLCGSLSCMTMCLCVCLPHIVINVPPLMMKLWLFHDTLIVFNEFADISNE